MITPKGLTAQRLGECLHLALVAHGCGADAALSARERVRWTPSDTADDVVSQLCRRATVAMPASPHAADAAARNAALASSAHVGDDELAAWSRELADAFARRLRPGESWCPACGGTGQRLATSLDGMTLEVCDYPRCVGGRIKL